MTKASWGGASKLSTTERKILAGLRVGRTSQQISDELGISEADFVAVRRTTLRKLGAKNREQLMRLSKDITDEQLPGSGNPWHTVPPLWAAASESEGDRTVQLRHRYRKGASDFMALYQCLLFSAGVIDDWENLECDSDEAALAALIARAIDNDWDSAEIWLGDKLVHRLDRPKPQQLYISPPLRRRRLSA